MKRSLVKNTGMLYLLTLAKILLPLVTLPYLTRVLSTNSYGMVAYVKAFMTYVQLFIDFGFVLSATKKVVYASDNKSKLGRIILDTIIEKLILAMGTFIILVGCISFIPILNENALFVILYFISIVLSIFLVDFYFRGIERMEMIAFPYVISKTISTLLTVILIKSDADVLLIPIMEIFGTFIACVVVIAILFKSKLNFAISNIKVLWNDIRESSVFFISNFATTFLGSFTTIVAGATLQSSEIAYWSVCMQLVSAIKILYSPITNSLYPSMLQEPKKRILKMTMIIIMPVVVFGCVVTFLFSNKIIFILGGAKYVAAGAILRYLVPVLLFSFPSLLFGWPALGAIGKERENTITTIISALFQLSIIFVFFVFNIMTLKMLAISCSISEFILFITRYYVYRKNIFMFK